MLWRGVWLEACSLFLQEGSPGYNARGMLLHSSRYTSWPVAHTDAARRLQVTDNIGQLTSLTSLTFTECPLDKLSNSISRLQNLRHLRLEGSFFPKVHCRQTGLQRFILPVPLLQKEKHHAQSPAANVSHTRIHLST